MKKSLHNKFRLNHKLSKINNRKGGKPPPRPPNYMYLIYTSGLCAEGTYLYHVRYLGFNLKQAFQYYHCLFNIYNELIQERHIRSGVNRITLNQCRGYSEIGRNYLYTSGQPEWLQNPSNEYSTVKIINAFNFSSVLRKNAMDNLFERGINTDAYDSYLPILAKLDVSSGRVSRDIFFHEDAINDDTLAYDEQLYNFLDQGNVVPSAYSAIDVIEPIPSKTVTLHLQDDLNMFRSSQESFEEFDIESTKNIINKRYPNLKELNSIHVIPALENNSDVILSKKAYTFNIPIEGLDISQYNVVLSNDYMEFLPEEETALQIQSIDQIVRIVNRV
jgi:hypothetical protein